MKSFRVTEHPTQEWTVQQIREAFPWDQTPRYLLRDRDAIYSRDFAATTTAWGWRTWLQRRVRLGRIHTWND
jgi:hypothetical protein